MDPEKLSSRARGKVSEKYLTASGGGGILRSGYLDQPFVTYLDDGEQPHHLFQSEAYGVRETDDGDETMRKPDTPYRLISAVTDRRVLAVLGCKDGDEVISVSHEDIAETNFENGLTKRYYSVTTHDGTRYDIYATAGPDRVKTAIEYLDEQVTSEPDDAGQSSASATSSKVARSGPASRRAYLQSQSESGETETETDDSDPSIAADSRSKDTDRSSTTSRSRDARRGPTSRRAYLQSQSGSGEAVTEDRSENADDADPTDADIDDLQQTIQEVHERNERAKTHVRRGDLDSAVDEYERAQADLDRVSAAVRENDIGEVEASLETARTTIENQLDRLASLSPEDVPESAGPADSLSRTDLKKTLQAVDEYEFEQLVADIWERLGWSTAVTAEAGDRGVDVVARQQRPFAEKHLIQAKRFSEGNNVGSPEVQQYASLKQQDPDATAVVIVTTSSFTAQAESLADSLDVRLVDGESLCDLIAERDLFDLVDRYRSP